LEISLCSWRIVVLRSTRHGMTWNQRTHFVALLLAFGSCVRLATAGRHAMKYPELTHDGGDEGCENCKQCTKRRGSIKGRIISVECRECDPGFALLHGPRQTDHPTKVKQKAHCAKLKGERKHVTLIRHGQSNFNVAMDRSKKAAIVTGSFKRWVDSPLSRMGLRQAQRLASILRKADDAPEGLASDDHEGDDQEDDQADDAAEGIASDDHEGDDQEGGEQQDDQGGDNHGEALLEAAERSREPVATFIGGLTPRAAERFLGKQAQIEQDGVLLDSLKEMAFVDLERMMKIRKRGNDASVGESEVSDDQALTQLQENKEDLEVLLGKKCNETQFVTSQLVRAMDTLLISTLPSRFRCRSPYHISSNLQEIEFNKDCKARTDAGMRPVVAVEQKAGYGSNQMHSTAQYVQARYSESDTIRFVKNLNSSERSRYNNHTATMLAELHHIFASPNLYTVWGGHSIWFRFFFQIFGDRMDKTCRKLGSGTGKIANTAVVSANLYAVEDSYLSYVATDCKLVYLGYSDDYKPKLRDAISSKVPVADDFRSSFRSIMGYKCCCSRMKYHRKRKLKEIFKATNYLEKCVIVFTASCTKVGTWKEVQNEETAVFKKKAKRYKWKHAYSDGEDRCTA